MNEEKSGTTMFRILRNAGRAHMNVMWDEKAGAPTASTKRIHELVHTMAYGIYNKHLHNKPEYAKYHDICKDHMPKEKPPTGPPSTDQLYGQAQRANPASSSGMDGTLPIELKQLPKVAWESRRSILVLSRRLRKHPKC